MKKLLLLLLIAGVSYAQSGNPIVDSLAAHRTVLDSLGTEVDNQVLTTGSTMTGNLTFNDDVELRLGTSADMKLVHDGTANYLLSVAKNLYLNSSGEYNIYFGTGVVYDWQLDSDGNFIPFATGSYDLGDATHEVDSIYAQDMYVSNDILLEDGGRLSLGTGADAYISHSGLALSILNATGTMGIISSSGAVSLGTIGAYALNLLTNTSKGWNISSSGHLLPYVSDGTYDIGSSTYAVRNVYADSITLGGTDLQTQLDAKVTTANIGGQIADSIEADTRFFSSSIVYPTSAENVVLFRAPYEIEIDSVHAVLSGTASCSTKVNIQWGDSRTSADSELFYGDQWVSSTTGASMTGDTYSTIIYQGEWVWFKTSDLVGTVYDINLTVTYHKH